MQFLTDGEGYLNHAPFLNIPFLFSTPPCSWSLVTFLRKKYVMPYPMPQASRGNIFPFSAIIGQELLKKALILNAIDNTVGGVLIRGERGTAKSTAVRAFAALLPEQDVVIGCPFGCDPGRPEAMCGDCRKDGAGRTGRSMIRIVELPVSATEDKVVGSLDITAAIKEGKKKFEPGVLADANRNILYVDEINLLNDHVVDVLLDAAAMGYNTVEREGISFTHPSSFILVGTMNPEEGELRPQLLDRFGLCVNIEGIDDSEKRMEIIQRRMEYESDPSAYAARWKAEDSRTAESIITARTMLRKVNMSPQMKKLVVEICIDSNVDGHRADLVMVKAAMAIAAFDGRTEVSEKDVREAAVLVLAHRTHNPPPPQAPPEEEEQDQDDNPNEQEQKQQPPPPQTDSNESDSDGKEEPDSSGTTTFDVGEQFKVRSSALKTDLRIDSILRDSSGRRTETESTTGRYVGYRMPHGRPTSVAFDATIRAASMHQHGRSGGTAIKIEMEDVREKIKERKTEELIVFVVDASGSMGAQQRMVAVKGAISSLLTDAYQKRDRVALVVFRGETAEAVVPPTGSVVLAQKRMEGIPTGGKTPLSKGLMVANEIIMKERRQDLRIKPMLIVISDGRANVSDPGNKPMDEVAMISAQIRAEEIPCLVIDSEAGAITLGFAKKLAAGLDARYMRLEDLRADTLSGAVGEALGF